MSAVRAAGRVLVLGAALASGCDGRARKLSPSADPQVVSAASSLRTWREDSDLVLEITLADTPPGTTMLALGLKVPGGSSPAPKEVAVLPPAGSQAGSGEKVAFKLGGPGGRDCLCLQVRYALPPGEAVGDRGVFTLALGEPSAGFSRRMGITTCVSAQDGSPFLLDPQAGPVASTEAGSGPVLAAPQVRVRSVQFRLTGHQPGAGGGPAAVTARIEPPPGGGEEIAVMALPTK